jgi:hypothetical protein
MKGSNDLTLHIPNADCVVIGAGSKHTAFENGTTTHRICVARAKVRLTRGIPNANTLVARSRNNAAGLCSDSTPQNFFVPIQSFQQGSS